MRVIQPPTLPRPTKSQLLRETWTAFARRPDAERHQRTAALQLALCCASHPR